jgi:hypothetical protein
MAGIDRQLVDRAIWAPIINERGVDFVSARVGNHQLQPYMGVIGSTHCRDGPRAG